MNPAAILTLITDALPLVERVVGDIVHLIDGTRFNRKTGEVHALGPNYRQYTRVNENPFPTTAPLTAPVIDDTTAFDTSEGG